MIVRNVILLVVLLAFGSVIQAQSAEPIRLALVSQSSGVAAVADLLTVKLSGSTNLQLLERNEIEKVYREQALSAGNRDLLKLGHVLGADGLLLLELAKAGDKEFLTVRLVAVKPGVVLASERFPWPLSGIPEWCQGVADHVRPLIPKLGVLRKDAIPISILNLRSSLQTDEARELERQLTILTAERLSRERRLFVLERRAMDRLAEENERKGLDDSGFWTGSFLLEGTIDPDGYSDASMTIIARLTPPNGGAAVSLSITCARTNLLGAANQLAEKTLAAFKIDSGLAWNAADEAKPYVTEAKWAFQWGLYSQAQDASESAWALGERTREMAALRISAYAEPVWHIDEHTGNVMFPVYPDPGAFTPLTRAGVLFLQALDSEFPNGARLDGEWFMIGFRALREVDAILEGYYLTAELRAGHEAELAELRGMARKLESVLAARIPEVWEPNAPNAPGGQSWFRALNGRRASEIFGTNDVLEKFDRTRWDLGGVWFDHPADAIPLFHRVIENGYQPTEPPRFAAWTWRERRGIPELTTRFIRDLISSTNTALRLEGLFLRMARAGADPEGGLQEGEQELIDAIWERRDWVLADARHISLLKRAQEALDDSFTSRSTSQIAKEALSALMFRVRKELLQGPGSTNTGTFDELFPSTDSRLFTAAQAGEIIPLMESFGARVPWKERVRDVADRYRKAYGLKILNPQPVVAPILMPRESPVAAKFIKWNYRKPFGDYLRPKIQSVITRGKRVWARVAYLSEYMYQPWSGDHTPVSYLSIDPKTGDCREIPFPRDGGNTDAGFEVTEDSLYVSVGDHVDRYRFGDDRWESIPVPMHAGAQLAVLGNQLFLANDEGLLDLDLNSHQVRVLVSSRRSPPLNELDSAWGARPKIYARNDGRLGLILGTKVFGYDPTGGGTWESPTQHPPYQTGGFSYSFHSDENAFFLIDGPYRAIMVTTYRKSEPKPVLLLVERATNDFPNVALEKLVGAPVWDWPEPFELDNPCFAPQGGSLWALYPRTRPPGMAPTIPKPMELQDDRNATLMVFEPGVREGARLPVRFEKDNEPYDPFKLITMLSGFGSPPPGPFCSVTPDGLFVACAALGGHWLIATNELKSFVTNSVPENGSRKLPATPGGSNQGERVAPAKAPGRAIQQ